MGIDTINKASNVFPAGIIIWGGTVVGITASTSQSQGNGAMDGRFNEVSVVGSDNDTVTMPEASAGRQCIVINNGANTLQIFPALGDDLGTGVNLSTTLEANETIEYLAYNSVNWKTQASTEIFHAEMFDTENSDAFIINAQTDDHMYHTNGLTAGGLAGWTFDAGGAGSPITIDSIADGAVNGVDIAVTCVAHGLSVGDIISQSVTDAAYTDAFVVKAIISDDIYEVAAVFGSTATAKMDHAATLICTPGSEGSYKLNWSVSATVVSNNDIFVFAIHIEAAHQAKTNIERKFGVAADIGAMSGSAIINVGSGEHVSFMVRNTVGSGNITLKDLNVNLVRL